MRHKGSQIDPEVFKKTIICPTGPPSISNIARTLISSKIDMPRSGVWSELQHIATRIRLPSWRCLRTIAPRAIPRRHGRLHRPGEPRSLWRALLHEVFRQGRFSGVAGRGGHRQRSFRGDVLVMRSDRPPQHGVLEQGRRQREAEGRAEGLRHRPGGLHEDILATSWHDKTYSCNSGGRRLCSVQKSPDRDAATRVIFAYGQTGNVRGGSARHKSGRGAEVDRLRADSQPKERADINKLFAGFGRDSKRISRSTCRTIEHVEHVNRSSYAQNRKEPLQPESTE